jgi:hypothetical protein
MCFAFNLNEFPTFEIKFCSSNFMLLSYSKLSSDFWWHHWLWSWLVYLLSTCSLPQYLHGWGSIGIVLTSAVLKVFVVVERYVLSLSKIWLVYIFVQVIMQLGNQ